MQLSNLSTRFGPVAVEICRILEAAGFSAEIVGGCVRDALSAESAGQSASPNDIDLTTSARPDQVRSVFRARGWRTYAQGRGGAHGTIGVIGPDGETYEVTTYRRDVETDGRHAVVAFADSLEEDLERRDFTINAIAVRVHPSADVGEVLDPYGGAHDLARGVLRAVGRPEERFREDRLRVLRGYRFAARFGLTIHPETRAAMAASAPHTLERVSWERIREELLKMGAQTQVPGRFAAALRAMHEDGLLEIILPEVAAGAGVTQGAKYHVHDVFSHTLLVADHAGFVSLRDGRALSAQELSALPDEEQNERALFRLAALLHDIGKVPARTERDGKVEFHGHEIVGADMAREVMNRLKASNAQTEWVVEIVRQHMRILFLRGQMTDANLRRVAADLTRVTPRVLLAHIIADKVGSGRKESRIEDEERLDILSYIERLEREAAALKVSDLALRGNEARDALGIREGRRMWEIGATLQVLLEEVVEDPALNHEETLRERLPAAHAEALRRGYRKSTVRR